MPNLKDIQIKISGIKKTQQITKAMNMVAAAKFRGAQEKVEEFRPYASKFSQVMGQLSEIADPNAFPLMEIRDVKKVCVLLVTADRGLCGAFNANLINETQKYLRAQQAEGKDVAVICLGRKGYGFFSKSGVEVPYHLVDCMANPHISDAKKVGMELTKRFLDGEFDEVHLMYGKFVNVVTQKPTLQKLLPISPQVLAGPEDEESQDTGPKPTYIYEPGPEEILDTLMPMFINVQILASMLETGASEQAARMTAMDNASRACKDMIESLTLTYNKARQAAITAELMDIVGGAEALKG